MIEEQPTSVAAQSQGDTSLEIANNTQHVVQNGGPIAQPAEATKTKRISTKAKEELIKYFTDSKWPRNKKMPKANGDAGLDRNRIINEFGLERSQASYQLSKWKKATYEKAQVQILIDSTDAIKEAIEESMSETWNGFRIAVLHNMLSVIGNLERRITLRLSCN